ncbi:MAG: hypothetical protein K2M88_07845 [Muribaculaceae bacterium]|nr:hypothetical protein [Muribaculaceae bacterium]
MHEPDKKHKGHDRKAIRKYLLMTEEEFMAKGYTSRLDKYMDFIVWRLENYAFLSSVAIHTQLRLNFPDPEKFNQKTVYNYVQKIRREENPVLSFDKSLILQLPIEIRASR